MTTPSPHDDSQHESRSVEVPAAASEVRQALIVALLAVGIALVATGLVLGLTPVTVGDDGFGGDGFYCGSAFVTNSDLTDLGAELCLLDGGAADRRINAIAAIAAGSALTIAAILVGMSENPNRWRINPNLGPAHLSEPEPDR